MMTLKVGEKELNVKFGFEATLKTRLLSRMAKMEKEKEGGMESMEDMMLFLPDVLLIGLQKFHSDEYGFNYENGEGKNEQLEKMFPLIEEYFDFNEKEDAITLYNGLTEEMLQNGFLKSQFQKELAKAEKAIQITETSENSEN